MPAQRLDEISRMEQVVNYIDPATNRRIATIPDQEQSILHKGSRHASMARH
jgi:hypothetical protein